MLAWFSTRKILTLLLTVLILSIVLPAFYSYIDKEIDKAIRTEASDVSQCRTFPVGEKACGGPAWYIIYSTETTDIDRYLSLSAIRDKLRTIPIWLLELMSGPAMSTCDVETPPTIEFVDGKCVELKN
jgi:hypothetical protein